MTDSKAGVSGGPQSSGLAIGGLVCGLIGLLFLGIILGPVAFILGMVAHRRAASGMAKAAIILGVVDLVLAIVWLVALSSGGLSPF